MRLRFLPATALAASALLFFACGSDTGSGTSTAGSVAGTVVKGPVAGATVTAYAVDNGAMGTQLGQATTDSSGNFSVPVGSYSGPMVIQASGGSYTDEATDSSMPMLDGDVITCAISSTSAGGATTGLQLTPLTSMAQAMAHDMSGGMTGGNIDTANADVGAYFSVGDIVHTAPMDPTTSGSGAGATADARNYGMSIAAMSQYAKAMGMISSSAMVTAMMDDASDGVMNGMMGSTAISMGGMGGMMGNMMSPTAGTTGLSQAMADFISSGMNRSGVSLTDMQQLMSRLGGSSGQMMGTTTGAGTITGTATKGPVGGATVTAYAIADGAMGSQLGTATTDTSGNFTLSIGSYSGPVMLQMKGGTYTDEATDSTMSMLSNDVLTATVPAVTTGATTSGVQLDPLTTMAQARAQAMSGGMTVANITAANTAVGTHFSVSDILHTMPMNPLVAGSATGATADARDAGMAIAAMSQYAKTLGMTSSSAIVTALAEDASDGVMNGMMGSTSISMGGMSGMGGMGGTMMSSTAGTTGLAAAMTTFIGSPMNASGLQLTDMQALIDQLMSSNGQLAAP